MPVYLTLQRPIGTRGGYSKTITTQKCGGYPYEIALRFAGCNLKCGACFAAGYSWSDSYKEHYRVKANIPIEKIIADYQKIRIPKPKDHYNWLRILGGEPLLNEEYINYLFEIILKITQISSKLFNDGIVIQTNGIFVGKGNTTTLEQKLQELYELNPKLKVAIEVSIKGTNEDEFALITRSDKRLFKDNINAYYKLQELELPNLKPVIIAGYGISESYLLREGKNPNSMITLLFNEDTPTYHPSIWSDEFKELYIAFTEKYGRINKKFERMPMYGLKDNFQYKWVGSTIKRTKEVYRTKIYDSKYSPRNTIIESKFKDILAKFFLIPNQDYYSFLIK